MRTTNTTPPTLESAEELLARRYLSTYDIRQRDLALVRAVMEFLTTTDHWPDPSRVLEEITDGR